MSGPGGHGSPSTSPSKFAGLVSRLRKSQDDRHAVSIADDDGKPSKGLPRTGLKRNTEEWKEKHQEDGESKENGKSPYSKTESVQGTGKKGGGWGRNDSSSSIPDNATAGEEEERPEDQEGADGRGPGRHEKRLGGDDVQMTESPGEEDGPQLEEKGTGKDEENLEKYGLGPAVSVSIPSAATREEKEKEKGQASVAFPKGHGHEDNGTPKGNAENGHAENGHLENGSNESTEKLNSKENGHDENEFLEEERAAKHDSPRNRKLTDELGNRPDVLPPVKEEEKPGPRNDIVLDPRVVHMHYHQQIDHTITGLKKGPILKVTPDGEAELPPGQTPKPSRRPSQTSQKSSTSKTSKQDGHDESHLSTHSHRGDRAPSQESDVEELDSDNDTVGGGTWRSAMEPSKSKGKQKSRPNKQRWSSFRKPSSDHESGQEEETASHRSPSKKRQSTASSMTSVANPNDPEAHEKAQEKWNLVRSRVLPNRSGAGTGPSPGVNKVSATAHTAVASIPITTELMVGQLAVMMMKTYLSRDEEGRRAVPVLLSNLKFRVGDSVGLKEGQKQTGREMFKLECEYGDGAVKWVIYRELRDFISLHAHYKAANIGTRVTNLGNSSRRVEIPEFPRMSIPYLNKIGGGKDGREGESKKEKPHGKAEYAQAGRDALQQYLVDLLRSVLFRPESNRLCKFFELSALTLQLAPRGGFQGKAGFLKMPGGNAGRRADQPGLTPMSWKASRDPKWFIVRDTYFVATDGPEESNFHDVFMIDSDFAIERPKRAYRTGLHLLSGKGVKNAIQNKGDSTATAAVDDDHIDTDNPLTQEMIIQSGEGKGQKADEMHDESEHDASQHTFFIINSQRKLKLVAKNARQMHQFIVSMERVAAQCAWTGRNRFDSFAPIRVNVAAQWLVDGRDYFWNLSRAINMAKERVYIHDWWISPELYLRRPGDERYRLDNLLKRKAEEGVKIFIIVYNEVSDKTTPTDSLYVKKTLTGLHPNIMIQRSPSHFQTGTFYWSHHEKMCVIDETIAFMGGFDLCYGRWDTSQHVLIDDTHTAPDGPDGPVWRGKDYANERVAEFANLDKPFDDTFDRNKVPRMPWHDVGLQLVGQPARDLCRHFVQRWNLLIRTKNHKRPLPFLLPAADFTERELAESQLQGTCEVQICRSCGPWSMGHERKIEHSIQNAYRKSIQLSEHFIYIENQFFITSTVVDGVNIENGIGDALVERIIRAHKEGTKWRACIVIPLLPGYTFPIDSAEASSVRLILECQNRTISRGTNSIFSRLRKEKIDPDDYISFFSLRGWGKFKSGALTTEQVYIHGKTMIVDDPNINERSQRGDRDSELLAVVRDTDMIDGTMAGKPYKVGRYAHTLRMRLMREHVGVDVDAIEEDQLMARGPIAETDDIETWDPDHEQEDEDDPARGVTKIKRQSNRERVLVTAHNAIGSVTKGMSENALSNLKMAADKVIHPLAVVAGGDIVAAKAGRTGEKNEREDFDREGLITAGFASSLVPTLEEKTIFERRPSATHRNGEPLFALVEENADGEGPAEAQVPGSIKKDAHIMDSDKEARKNGAPQIPGNPEDKEMFGAPANATTDDDVVPNEGTERDEATDAEKAAIAARKVLRKHLSAKVGVDAWTMPTPTPIINPDRFHDPLDETFWKDMWVAVAVHNTEIFRKVFRCIPDDLVTSWASYKAFANHAEKFNKAPEDVSPPGSTEPVKVVHDGPGTHGAGGGGSGGGVVDRDGGNPGGDKADTKKSDVVNDKPSDLRSANSSPTSSGSQEKADRKASGTDEAWHDWEKEAMEKLLQEVRGHLVIYSTRFMEAEDLANNFLFNSDKILPLPIYD